ncbi:MAG: hypothetical protein ACOVKO_02935 [Elstera sp.]
MLVKFRLVLAATAVALAACTALPPPPAKLSTVAANGFDSYQTRAFDNGYFATDLKGQSYAYAWIDRGDELDPQIYVCSPLGCTATKRYGQNSIYAALTVCREIAREECTIYAEGVRRR